MTDGGSWKLSAAIYRCRESIVIRVCTYLLFYCLKVC